MRNTNLDLDLVVDALNMTKPKITTSLNKQPLSPLVPFADKIPNSIKKKLYIGDTNYFCGQVKQSSKGKKVFSLFQSEDGPFPLGSVPQQTPLELSSIVESLESSYPKLQKLSIKDFQRLAVILSEYMHMPEVLETIATTMMVETGKLKSDCEKELTRTAEFLTDLTTHLAPLDLSTQQGEHQVRATGKGLGIHYSPTNYPINEGFTVVFTRLVAGNPMLWKAPSRANATCHAFEMLVIAPALQKFAAEHPGFPANCLAMVYDDSRRVTPFLAAQLKHVSFIGGDQGKNAVWKLLSENNGPEDRAFASDTNNPYVILDNKHDMPSLVKKLIGACYSNRGERCTSAGIMFVPDAQKSEFVAEFEKQLLNMPLGLPWEEAVKISSPTGGTSKNSANLKKVMDAISKFDSSLLLPKSTPLFKNGIMKPVLLQVDPVSPPALEDSFGILSKVAFYHDQIELEKNLAKFFKHTNRGQQLCVFGDQKQASQFSEQFSQYIGGIFINCAGSRGPDSLPFEHLGFAGHGHLSGFEAMYRDSVRLLRTTVKTATS